MEGGGGGGGSGAPHEQAKRQRTKKGDGGCGGGGKTSPGYQEQPSPGSEAKRQRRDSPSKPETKSATAGLQDILAAKRASGELVDGSHWILGRSNLASVCAGCGEAIESSTFRLIYRPSLQVQFGSGRFFKYHHIREHCLAKGGCPLFDKKEDFGWSVANLPRRISETPEARERAIQKNREASVAAAKAAARLRTETS